MKREQHTAKERGKKEKRWRLERGGERDRISIELHIPCTTERSGDLFFRSNLDRGLYISVHFEYTPPGGRGRVRHRKVWRTLKKAKARSNNTRTQPTKHTTQQKTADPIMAISVRTPARTLRGLKCCRRCCCCRVPAWFSGGDGRRHRQRRCHCHSAERSPRSHRLFQCLLVVSARLLSY